MPKRCTVDVDRAGGCHAQALPGKDLCGYHYHTSRDGQIAELAQLLDQLECGGPQVTTSSYHRAAWLYEHGARTA